MSDMNGIRWQAMRLRGAGWPQPGPGRLPLRYGKRSRQNCDFRQSIFNWRTRQSEVRRSREADDLSYPE